MMGVVIFAWFYALIGAGAQLSGMINQNKGERNWWVVPFWPMLIGYGLYSWATLAGRELGKDVEGLPKQPEMD